MNIKTTYIVYLIFELFLLTAARLNREQIETSAQFFCISVVSTAERPL